MVQYDYEYDEQRMIEEMSRMERAQQSALANNAFASLGLTVAQNIDNRIAGLRERISRLEEVKQKLSRGTILDVSLEDLQMALGRY